MADDAEWLNLLERDAPADEFTALGARLQEADGRSRGDDTAAALRLKLLLQQRAQRASELAALNDIAQRLSALHGPDGMHRSEDVLAEIVDQARQLLRVDLAYLGLVEQEPEPAMRIAVSAGALRTGLVGLTVPLYTSLAGEVIRSAEPRWVSDYGTSTAFQHHEIADTVAASESMRGLLGVPLIVRGAVIGALFACKRTERSFTDDEVVLLSGLAAHAAIAIDTSRAIERLATARDELARRTAELERAAALTEQLTQLVLRGGGVDDLLSEVRAAVSAPLRFVRVDQRGAAEDAGVIVRRVMAGRRDFGTLLLTPAGDAVPEDVRVLDQSVPVLALALVADEAVAEAVRHAQDSLVAELLTTPLDDAAAKAVARRAGLDAAARYLVVVVDATGDASATLRRLQQRPWPHGSRLAVIRGEPVALVPAAGVEGVRRLWASGELPTGGMAGPAAVGPHLAERHAEASATVAALAALGIEGELRTADELGVFRILLSHSGRRELDAARERSLGALEAEERRRGVPLLATLDRFLTEGQRPGPTAKALGIHVNTLYQRLVTLDRLLGAGWREPSRALELQLLLRVRDAAGSARARLTAMSAESSSGSDGERRWTRDDAHER